VEGAATSRRYELQGIAEIDKWSLLRIPIGVISFLVTAVLVGWIGLMIHLPGQVIGAVSMAAGILLGWRLAARLPSGPAVYVTLTEDEVVLRRSGVEDRFANHTLVSVRSGINEVEVRGVDGRTRFLPATVAMAPRDAPHWKRGAAHFSALRMTLVVEEGRVRLRGTDLDDADNAQTQFAPW
jgi:hypothetical protein